MKSKIILIILTVFFIGCKNESTKKEVSGEEKIVSDRFKVTLSVIVKKDDNFQIYYIENSSENFTEEKSIWVNVKGSEAPQKVVFELPKDYVPYILRFDFGLSDKQDDIILSDIEMNYFDKKLNFKGQEIANYFRPLEPTIIDFKTGTIKALFKDGKRIESVLHPQEILLAEQIKKITR